jgi:hypothetical protein
MTARARGCGPDAGIEEGVDVRQVRAERRSWRSVVIDPSWQDDG